MKGVKFPQSIFAFLLTILLFSSAGRTFAIAADSLSINQMTSIKTYIRIWGLLKYYSSAAQNQNWDSLFVAQVNGYSEIENLEILNHKIKHFISTYSRQNREDTNPVVYDTALPMNISYKNIFSFPVLSEENRVSIHNLILHRRRGIGKYAFQDTANEIPRFRHEPFHTTDLYPSKPYRLLALARYWNMIAFFYPYKYLIDEQPWSEALNRLIPKFIDAKDSTDYWYCLAEMITGIHDSHAGLSQANGFQPFGNYYVPFWGSLIDSSLFVSIVFKKDLPLVVGDEIIAIDDQPVSKLINQQRPFLSASNESFFNLYVPPRFLNGNDSLVKLEIKDKGEILIQRYDTTVFRKLLLKAFENKTSKPYYKIKGRNIGYVNLGLAASKDVRKIMRKFKHTDGIIFDLRHYPVMNIWNGFAKYLSDERRAFCNYYVADFDLLGTFKKSNTNKVGRDRRLRYHGIVAVLVNVNTQSRGEFCAMAFKTFPNTVIVGGQTAGTDGDVTKVKLPGGYFTWITAGGVTYPDGIQCQRVGIVPDIEVKMTPMDIKTHNDPYLKAAINYIEGHK